MCRQLLLLSMIGVLLGVIITLGGGALRAEEPDSQLEQADNLLGLQEYGQAEQVYLDIVQQGGADAFPAVRQLACPSF